MANYSGTISHAAQKYHIDPKILTALLRQESGLREGVTSSAGAQDIAQFMPATAKAYGVTLGDGNPTDDIMGAAHYLSDNLKRTHGDIRGALSIYNSGRPDAYKNPNFAKGQTFNYVKSIMAMAGAGGNSQRSSAGTDPGGYQAINVPDSVDQDAKRTALLQWMATRGQPGALGTLLEGLKAAKTPGSTQVIPDGNSGGESDGSVPDGNNHGGTANFGDARVANWIAPILEYARQHGWEGQVNSGYRNDAEQKRIYDSGVRPAAKPRAYGGAGSNHEFTMFPGGAIDVSNAEQLSQILMNSPYARKLVYAGAKDPVHFSHPHNGSY